MIKFYVTLSIGNDAFGQNPEQEISRILKEIAMRVEDGDISGRVLDSNGNGVCNFGILEDYPERWIR